MGASVEVLIHHGCFCMVLIHHGCFCVLWFFRGASVWFWFIRGAFVLLWFIMCTQDTFHVFMKNKVIMDCIVLLHSLLSSSTTKPCLDRKLTFKMHLLFLTCVWRIRMLQHCSNVKPEKALATDMWSAHVFWLELGSSAESVGTIYQHYYLNPGVRTQKSSTIDGTLWSKHCIAITNIGKIKVTNIKYDKQKLVKIKIIEWMSKLNHLL